VAATEDFCVYGTSSGSIEFFYFAEWTLLAGVELRHEEPIRSVFPNPKGTRLVFIDASYRGFLFNPVNHLVMPVLKMHETTKNVLWDAADWGVFVTTDNK
jgi:WD repeat-containing protein 19